jgi:hypothetical protein
VPVFEIPGMKAELPNKPFFSTQNQQHLKNMKPIAFFTALLLLANFSSLQAQTLNTWKGGFPGHETEWNNSRNWSLGRTPGIFDRVVIPDVSTSTRRYPVVPSGVFEVQRLEIQAGASLTLHRSARIVADAFLCNGACIGCEQRVLIEGEVLPVTASRQ